MQPRFIILISLLLLSLAPGQKLGPKGSTPQIKGHPIHTSYLFGIKKQVPRKLKEIHKALGIQHFMTPSGLHLTIFTSLLFIFIENIYIRFVLLLGLGLISSHFNHIDSFQRMIFFAALRHNPWLKLGSQKSFICTFIVLFFQYFTNPLSYSLSFLFLGIILCRGPNLRKLGYLVIGQFLVSFWFGQGFYTFGPIYGLVLTATSFFAFPILLIEFIFNLDNFTSIWVKLLELLYLIKGPLITIPFPSLIPFLLLGSIKIKRIALVLGLLLISAKLYNPRIPSFSSASPKGHSKIIKLKNGVKLLYPNGMYCYSRLKADQWVDHCYK